MSRQASFALRRRQVLAVARLELRRGFGGWRSLWLLFLAFAPIAIISVHALRLALGADNGRCRLEEETLILAAIVQVFYLRFGIFFGCLGIFVRAIRGEIAERSLHYHFLAPMRREVLVLGKFLASGLAATLVFGTGVVASFALMYGHFDAGREFVTNGPGLGHLRAYLLVTALACLGYGAVFLALSLVLRNPIVPAVIVFFCEGLSGMLPVWLKRLTVTFYLKPLLPVNMPVEGFSGLFTVVAEPMPAWLAVAGLIAFAAAVLAFACWRIRRLEISYSTD